MVRLLASLYTLQLMLLPLILLPGTQVASYLAAERDNAARPLHECEEAGAVPASLDPAKRRHAVERGPEGQALELGQGSKQGSSAVLRGTAVGGLQQWGYDKQCRPGCWWGKHVAAQ